MKMRGGRRYMGLEERLRLYNEVVRLRKQGLGYKRIAKAIKEKYGVSLNPGMICNWVKGRYHPLGRCNKIVKGPGLAYVIGGWLGDGSLNVDDDGYKYCIRLSCNDYEFAEEWGRCLAEALGRPRPYTPRWDDDLERWIVKGSSILLYNPLKRVKEETPWILMPYLEDYPAEACRGFFDAEGWVNLDYYRIMAANTDTNIISLLKKLLEKLGINCRTHRCRQKEFMISPRAGKLYRRNSEFMTYLAIYGEENILRFAEKVGFTIARKQVELMKLVRRYHES
ncbi:MAG: hypothetical protein J7L79_04115 [Thaumarchaeota archaeon]|nr:hypothetical protein [Nitrososphaerota archaeon]